MPKKILSYMDDVDNVVWDWNGTLLDDLEVIIKAESIHFPLYGVTPPTLQQRNELFCFPIEKYYARVGFDFTKNSFSELNDKFMEIYNEVLNEAPLFRGMEEVLAEVVVRGKKQFILSAAPQSHLDLILENRSLRHHFHGVYGLAQNVADSKIARGRELLAEQKIDPARTLMIGDTDHDFEVAQALGFQALLIADGHKPYETLAALHHQVLKTRY